MNIKTPNKRKVLYEVAKKIMSDLNDINSWIEENLDIRKKLYYGPGLGYRMGDDEWVSIRYTHNFTILWGYFEDSDEGPYANFNTKEEVIEFMKSNSDKFLYKKN